MSDWIDKLEETHGAENSWVQYLQMSRTSPRDFEEAFKDEYAYYEDSLDRVAELASMVETLQPPHVVQGDLSLKEPLIVPGDLKVSGKLYTSSVLIVLGNVEAKVIRDCGPDSLIVIHGDVTTSMLWTDGEFHVAGDLSASELVYGYYNDNVLAANLIKAPVVVQDDHAMEGEIEAAHHIAYESQLPLKEVFVEGAFHEERGKLDQSFLAEKILAGEPVRR